jgi:hypothetical protein
MGLSYRYAPQLHGKGLSNILLLLINLLKAVTNKLLVLIPSVIWPKYLLFS